jgi:hypothetical protein
MARSSQIQTTPAGYYCPMHKDIRQAVAGTCTKCGMDLVPEGARFGLLRHVASMPRHLLHRPKMSAIMIAVMALIMALVMMS